MSHVRRETVQDIAESLGLSMPEGVAQALAPDVEYRTREVVQEALKFMRHSKRSRLSAADVNAALRLRNCEALYGFSDSDACTFKRAGVVGGTDLYYVDDKRVDLRTVIKSRLPSAPLDTHLMTHWLAVEGVQPAIPANPTPVEADGATGAAAAAAEAADGAIEAGGVRPAVKQMVSKELQLYFEKMTELILLGDTDTNRGLLRAALASLSSDTGLHPLTPLLVQFVADEITRNMSDVAVLSALMRSAKALLTNPNLHIEAYLHQLMPSILTCLVGKRLGVASKAKEDGNEGKQAARERAARATADHWELRDYAAGLVASVCERFGSSYQNLQPRITRTLLRTLLDPAKPLTTHYGAIVGIAALGPRVVQLLLMPNLSAYLELLDAEFAKSADVKPESERWGEATLRRHEAGRCLGAAQAAVGQYFSDVGREGEKEETFVGGGDGGAQAEAIDDRPSKKSRVAPNPSFASGASGATAAIVSAEPAAAKQMVQMSEWLADGLRPHCPDVSGSFL